ncbi:MAG: transcription termination/antitermination protein NusG [Candidatus Marinimicrobia bacterium]|nr:transcription termination/antitermination protein NusG [Candidatus Neomarinimicrobiota bacterium]
MADQSEMQWYVLHTLSSQEYKVKESIDRRLPVEEMGEFIDEVLIPTERVAEVKQGKRTTSTRKFYPGYVLVHMHLYGPDNKLLDRPWYFIQETPGIIGFIGGERPVALRPKEVEQILNQIDEKQEKVKPRVEFEPGEMVKITDGPFVSFGGVIEEVDPDRGKLKISVSIFGRTAPVELEYWQVERA